jgi:hypothetical protein
MIYGRETGRLFGVVGATAMRLTGQTLGWSCRLLGFASLLSVNIYVVTFNIDGALFCCYVKPMIIEFDTAKREKTLLGYWIAGWL